MPSSRSNASARAVAKQLKVLVPPSFHKMRISEELAGCFDAGGGVGEGAPGLTALVVSPFGKVWRVEVGRDDDGAFLGRGWAGFLAAHGVGVGWFVVLRHEGGGALTFKAFDTSFCIKEFAAPAAVMASRSSKGVSCKPQFIRIIYPNFTEKMIIPARFVKRYVTEENLNSRTAVIFSPLGKFWQIELENDQSGMFFAGGWSQFLEFHGVSKGDVLLLRYEGNMVFKFKAFGLSGCQKDFKNKDAGINQNIEMQQESPSPIRKRKDNDEKSSSEKNKRPKSSVTSLNANPSLKKPDYQIEPSSWIRKEINTYMLERLLSFSIEFCRRIGFQNTCTITLKTEMDSTRSWKVHGAAYKNYCCIRGDGWKSFCQENRLKTGDLCTFNIIETTLWHVTIKHSPTLADTKKQKESPCSSRKEDKTKNGGSGSEGRMRAKCPVNSLSKAPKYTRAVYKIGPPSWIQKEMTITSLPTITDAQEQHETPFTSSRKHKSRNESLSSDDQNKQKGSMASLKNASSRAQYVIGPPAWLKKEISTRMIKMCISFPAAFCNAIGLREACTVTLKTSLSSTSSWQVRVLPYKDTSHQVRSGWKSFCEENMIKEGDVCTFNVIEMMLWHVVIDRC